MSQISAIVVVSIVPRKQRYGIPGPGSHGSQKASKDAFFRKAKKSYQTDSAKGSASLDIHKKLNSVWLKNWYGKYWEPKAMDMDIQNKNYSN